MLAGVPLIVSGCKKKASLAAEPAASAQAPASAAPAEKPAAEFKDARFQLKIEPKGSYKSGQSGQVQIVLTANAPFHCNDKYPYKFKLDAPGSVVSYPAGVARGMSVRGTRGSLAVPFSGKQAGSATISGTLYMSVCSSDQCMMDKRRLAVVVQIL